MGTRCLVSKPTLHLIPCQEVLRDCQDDKLVGKDGRSGSSMDWVNMPKRSQVLPADSHGPLLLSCGCASSDPATTIGNNSWSYLLRGHVRQPVAGVGTGPLGAIGAAGSPHGSQERKAKQINLCEFERILCATFIATLGPEENLIL